MRFLIVDDIQLILDEEAAMLRETAPDSEVFACTTAKEALAIAQSSPLDVAFLDIELGVVNGIQLAKQLKEIQRELRIIFVTSFTQYAVEAFSVHATGYLLKPVQKEDLKRELTFLYEDKAEEKKKVKVQTFGNFEVWAQGKSLTFGRRKSKELFAYLVAQRGASVSTREACSVLFEDARYDNTLKSYFQTIVSDMRRTLREADAGDVIIKSYNSLAVDIDKLDCDYYRFLLGDAKAINSYGGRFMSNYSWAEFLVGTLDSKG